MKIAAIGRTETLYNTIKALSDAGHEIVALLTAAPARDDDRNEYDFAELATSLGCAFRSATPLLDDAARAVLEHAQPELGICLDWPTPIDDEVLRIFPRGVVKAHAGALPRYRGTDAPRWAILDGDDRMAVTLHLLVSEPDAGPVLAEREIPIGDHVHISDLLSFFHRSCPDLFVEVIETLVRGDATPILQSRDPAEARHCCPLGPHTRRLDLAQSAEHQARVIRAWSEPYPGAYTHVDGARVIVWRARHEAATGSQLATPGQVVRRDPEADELWIACGVGNLVLERVQRDGKLPAGPCAAIDARCSHLGLDLVAEVEDLRSQVQQVQVELDRLRAQNNDSR